VRTVEVRAFIRHTLGDALRCWLGWQVRSLLDIVDFGDDRDHDHHH
jgi:hypothetical protein